MKILLVYPETPDSFWSFKHALKFISKKSSEPPLGLLTVAAQLPVAWEKKLIDMNVSQLKDKHLLWADYVFISGMDIQKDSFQQVVDRCRTLDVKVVAGGPMCTSSPEVIKGVDHLILDEAEITLPLFLEDLKNGCPKAVYTTDQYPDIRHTPIPLWHLLDMKKYSAMDVQYSRGCPYNCEFCSITALYGHKPRTKDTEQFLLELETLYQAGWRGGIMIVDDNFIGNKNKLKNDILPSLAEWIQTRGYPFEFITEVSINMADDERLMKLMREANFSKVFVGIETPDDNSLAECNKMQNRQRNLLDSVHILQRQGFNVSGGFIVGFDNDSPNIFDRQISFIQNSGIVTAMVGLLNAMPGTHLFSRLDKENRLLSGFNGNNVDSALNFVPHMKPELLIEGYRRILKTIYSQGAYFERVKTFLQEYRLNSITRPPSRINLQDIRAFIRALWRLGVLEKGSRFFWKLLFYVLSNCPQKFPEAISMAIRGFHLRRVAAAI